MPFTSIISRTKAQPLVRAAVIGKIKVKPVKRGKPQMGVPMRLRPHMKKRRSK